MDALEAREKEAKEAEAEKNVGQDSSETRASEKNIGGDSGEMRTPASENIGGDGSEMQSEKNVGGDVSETHAPASEKNIGGDGSEMRAPASEENIGGDSSKMRAPASEKTIGGDGSELRTLASDKNIGSETPAPASEKSSQSINIDQESKEPHPEAENNVASGQDSNDMYVLASEKNDAPEKCDDQERRETSTPASEKNGDQVCETPNTKKRKHDGDEEIVDAEGNVGPGELGT